MTLVILKTPYGRIIEVSPKVAIKRIRQGCVKLGKVAVDSVQRTRRLKI